ncbi:MAG: Asp23/Gls24 family envelope stress response protein [Oscillospiraceae bacterium]|nr:Asp23/Gls24 family envelope stress response protein [Oscillospiraceae bacterium]
MVTLQNHVGKISISPDYFTELIGNTVTKCFGVISMNVSGLRDTLAAALPNQKKSSFARGVLVRFVKNKLIIDLHISLMYGVNMNAVVRSIINKVGYTVEQSTGISVESVNVYVDSIRV